MRGDEIRIGKSKIAKLFEDHPDVDEKIIREIPKMLEKPILVMQSLTRLDSVVVLGELYTNSNKPLLISIKITNKKTNNRVTDIAVITSAHGRTKEQIQYLINNSRILYIDPDKKRTDSWLASLRVQFPSDVTEYGSINKITYADEVFNTKLYYGLKMPYSITIKGEKANESGLRKGEGDIRGTSERVSEPQKTNNDGVGRRADTEEYGRTQRDSGSVLLNEKQRARLNEGGRTDTHARSVDHATFCYTMG